MTSEVLAKYTQRFFEEISNAHYAVDRNIFSYFNSRIIAKIKDIRTGKPLGNKFSKHKTEFEMFKDAIENIPNMRFIYEMSFLEAFLKEFLKEQNKDLVKTIRKWKKFNKDNPQINLNKSDSPLNLVFVQFLIKDLFNNDLKLSDLQKEFGSLRNCLIHRNGIIESRDLPLLKNTLFKLNLEYKVGVKIRFDQFTSNSFFGFSLRVFNVLER